jgi:hypothetical protein
MNMDKEEGNRDKEKISNLGLKNIRSKCYSSGG